MDIGSWWFDLNMKHNILIFSTWSKCWGLNGISPRRMEIAYNEMIYSHRTNIARTNHRRWRYTDWMKWTDKDEDYECFWMTMSDCEWFWVILNNPEWFWTTMNDYDYDYEWLCLSMNDCEWTITAWMIISDCEWSWMIVNDYEWFSEVGLSMELIFSGWPCFMGTENDKPPLVFVDPGLRSYWSRVRTG